MITCPRKKCKRKAIVDRHYGVLPCKKCQAEDTSAIVRPSETYSLARSHRIQQARDRHAKDTVQPFMSGKANPDYFKIHPDQVDKYGVQEELRKV